MAFQTNLSADLLIVIPTYNERENLPTLTGRIWQHVPHAHLLIVDDNSPDGTGVVADALAQASGGRMFVLHRVGKEGLGRAYVAGFGWGLERGYQRLVQMDADLSHDPAHLPALLSAGERFPLVLGSRYVPGGGVRNWGMVRRILSWGGSVYARAILQMPWRDLTGGYKCWQGRVLADLDLQTIHSTGYSFQIEMTYRAHLRGHRITEVPITFADRVDGVSKMTLPIALEAVGRVWQLRLQRGLIQKHHAAPVSVLAQPHANP